VVSSTHLNPGEKGKISARVDIKGRAGSISKNVQVFSNDPKRPVVNLLIKALIRQ
jgi:hypothetical protein